jgi:hypothetical protein
MARALAALLVSLVVLAPGCWSKPAPGRRSNGAEPPISSASTRAPVVEALPLAPPRYRVFHVFPPRTRVWGVGPRLVACEADCTFDLARHRVPRTWLVDAQHVDEDATVFPRVSELDNGSVHYSGQYPDEVFAIVRTGHDEDTTDRPFLYHRAARGNHFGPGELPDGSSLVGFDPTAFAPPHPRCREHCEPFEVYNAEAQAAWRQLTGSDSARPPPIKGLLFGNGGPMLVIDDRTMALWNGSSWTRPAVAWCYVGSMGAVRLSTGASLVLSRGCEGKRDGVFWVSNTGVPFPIDVDGATSAQNLGEVRFRTVVEREHEVWLVADAASGTVLLSPVNPSEVKRPPP